MTTLKAELVIPEGYEKITEGGVEPDDLCFDSVKMTWEEQKHGLCLDVKVMICVIRKKQGEIR